MFNLFIIGKFVSEVCGGCNYYKNDKGFFCIQMNQDISLGEKKVDLVDIDLFKIRLSLIEYWEIFLEFLDYLYLFFLGFRSLEDKEF